MTKKSDSEQIKRNTAASFRLSDRELPPDHVRSEAVEQFSRESSLAAAMEALTSSLTEEQMQQRLEEVEQGRDDRDTR